MLCPPFSAASNALPRGRAQDDEPCQFSVLIPLADHREQAANCVRGWTQQQTLSRECYQVIVAGRLDDELRREIEPLLSKRDTTIDVPSDNVTELFHLASLKASAGRLMLTEGHAVPDRNCLLEMSRFVADNDSRVAFCSNVGASGFSLSRLEDELYENEERPEMKRSWEKIVIRGFCLPRALYFRLGGFPYKYGHFAEVAFGIHLREAGYRAEVAPRSIVHHHGAATTRELAPDLRLYGRHEMLFRSDHPVAFCEHHLGRWETWSQRSSYRRRNAAQLCLRILASLNRNAEAGGSYIYHGAILRLLFRYAVRAGFGLLPQRARSLLARSAGRVGLLARRGDPEHLYHTYYRYWEQQVHKGRLDFMVEWLEQPDAPAHKSETRFDVDRIDDSRLLGFYGIERMPGGRSFRWTEAAAMVQLPVEHEHCCVEIELSGARPADEPAHPRITVPGRAAPVPLHHDGSRIAFQASARHGTLEFFLSCAPFQPSHRGSGDKRLLGLPVAAIHVQPLQRGTAGEGVSAGIHPRLSDD